MTEKVKKKVARIAMIGSGSWGTALANLFADAGNPVTMWGRDPKVIESIAKHHKNPKYLSEFTLNPLVTGNSDLKATLDQSDVVVCSIPTQQIRNVFGPVKDALSGKWIINTSKGIEVGTHACVHEIFSDLAPKSPYLVLSGPSFAVEVMKRQPTAVTIACLDKAIVTEAQKLVSAPYFRAYSSQDVVGVELAGALKNVIAVASGMIAGLKLGYNTQAAVINRGIAEVFRMGQKMGAETLTFLGLAGMGDLILTCTGPLSRNRRLGELLGEGKTIEEAKKVLGGVAEGMFTAKSALELARAVKVEMPITNEIYQILYEGRTPQEALTHLMSRELKEEWS